MVRDRAQLLLAGSIAIAIVFIGLTIVLNSVIFTENISGGSSIEVTGDIDEFDHEVRRNTRSLTIRINHAARYNQSSTIKDNLRGNFTNYSRVLAESYADTGSVYVNVTYDSSTTIGYRIVQGADREYTRDDGAADWFPFDDPKEIGWFRLNVDATNVSTDSHFALELTNRSGDTLNVTIKREGADTLYVNSSVSGSHTSNVTCRSNDGRVLLDVLDGESFTGDCAFNATERLDSPYTTLRFKNGDETRGKYSIVLNESGGVPLPDCAPSPQDLCVAPAIWQIQVTTRYDTGAISYENVQTLDVYRVPANNLSAKAILVESSTSGADDDIVRLVLNNTRDTDTTVTHISVDSTNASNANWIRDSGKELTTNRSGEMDEKIKVGGSKKALDTTAVIPSGGATEFTLKQFGQGNAVASSDSDMDNKTLKFTLYFADGSKKQFNTTIPYP